MNHNKGAPSSSLDLTALRRTSVVPHNRDGCNYSSSVPNGRPRSFSCSTAVVSRYEQDFEELEKLGKGGYGRVYRVRNRLDGSELLTGQIYALKKIKFRNSNPDLLEKVLREVKTLASLNHPNVVRYHSAWLEFNPDASDSDSEDENDDSMSCDKVTRKNRANKTTNSCPRHAHTAGSRNHTDHDDDDDDDDDDHDDDYDAFDFNFGNVFVPFPKSSAASSIHVKFAEREDEESDFETELSSECNCSGEGSDSEQWSSSASIGIPSHATPAHHSGKGILTTLYVVMQLCTLTLQQWLESRTQINPLKNIEVFRQVCQALKYIHSRGIIHRDLKPSNMFLTRLESIASSPVPARRSMENLYSSSQPVPGSTLRDFLSNSSPAQLSTVPATSPWQDIAVTDGDFLVSLGDFGMATLSPDNGGITSLGISPPSTPGCTSPVSASMFPFSTTPTPPSTPGRQHIAATIPTSPPAFAEGINPISLYNSLPPTSTNTLEHTNPIKFSYPPYESTSTPSEGIIFTTSSTPPLYPSHINRPHTHAQPQKSNPSALSSVLRAFDTDHSTTTSDTAASFYPSQSTYNNTVKLQAPRLLSTSSPGLNLRNIDNLSNGPNSAVEAYPTVVTSSPPRRVDDGATCDFAMAQFLASVSPSSSVSFSDASLSSSGSFLNISLPPSPAAPTAFTFSTSPILPRPRAQTVRHINTASEASPFHPHFSANGPSPANEALPTNKKEKHTTGVGTPAYSSPEQRSGRYMPSTASDMYSLGIILFELYNLFSTKMERARVLTDLRNGVFPVLFAQNFPRETALVKWLMSHSPLDRPNIDQVLQHELLAFQYVFFPRSEIKEMEDTIRKQEQLISRQRQDIMKLCQRLSQGNVNSYEQGAIMDFLCRYSA